MKRTLVSIPANGKLPQSIIAIDNKSNVIFQVWSDGKITLERGKDFLVEEVKQATLIVENFDLFFHNIQAKQNQDVTELDHLSDTEKNLILSALTLSYTRYHTNYNGNEFMDFTFNNVDTQNAYADQFHSLESKLRKKLLPNK